jgi:hypothetical protein
MSNNPYQSPPTSRQESLDQTPPKTGVRLSVIVSLLIASIVVAHLITPADPLSSLLATVPIFLLTMLAYYFGLRA